MRLNIFVSIVLIFLFSSCKKRAFNQFEIKSSDSLFSEIKTLQNMLTCKVDAEFIFGKNKLSEVPAEIKSEIEMINAISQNPVLYYARWWSRINSHLELRHTKLIANIISEFQVPEFCFALKWSLKKIDEMPHLLLHYAQFGDPDSIANQRSIAVTGLTLEELRNGALPKPGSFLHEAQKRGAQMAQMPGIQKFRYLEVLKFNRFILEMLTIAKVQPDQLKSQYSAQESWSSGYGSIMLNKLTAQFPAVILFPTSADLNLDVFLRLRVLPLYLLGLSDLYFGVDSGTPHIDGHVRISPLEFFTHDLGHATNTNFADFAWLLKSSEGKNLSQSEIFSRVDHSSTVLKSLHLFDNELLETKIRKALVFNAVHEDLRGLEVTTGKGLIIRHLIPKGNAFLPLQRESFLCYFSNKEVKAKITEELMLKELKYSRPQLLAQMNEIYKIVAALPQSKSEFIENIDECNLN